MNSITGDGLKNNFVLDLTVRHWFNTLELSNIYLNICNMERIGGGIFHLIFKRILIDIKKYVFNNFINYWKQII